MHNKTATTKPLPIEVLCIDYNSIGNRPTEKSNSGMSYASLLRKVRSCTKVNDTHICA